jgi:hypothetical protein
MSFLALFALFNSRGMLSAGYPGGTDSMIFPTLVNYERFSSVSTWFSWLDWGQPSTFFQSPLIFAMSLFSDALLAYKFFVIISFFLSGVTSYFVASRLVGFPLSGLVSGLIYMNSQLLFSQFFEGHIDIMFGYALFPLAIYFAYAIFSASFTRIAMYSAFEALFLFSSHLNIAYIVGEHWLEPFIVLLATFFWRRKAPLHHLLFNSVRP